MLNIWSVKTDEGASVVLKLDPEDIIILQPSGTPISAVQFTPESARVVAEKIKQAALDAESRAGNNAR
jgi:hypothetical protein